MTDEQWERVKAITADALEMEGSSRAVYIDKVCAGDSVVLQEVERLLAASESSGFLSQPAADIHRLKRVEPAAPERFTAEQIIAGRFRIERFIGRGAMGEVYAALDLELQEHVALKTIAPGIAASSSAIERFKAEVRESRRIAHDSVCRVHDLFSYEHPPDPPVWFLTMKLIDGPTLAQYQAAHGSLPLEETIPLVADMARALSAAHAIGIIHRDLKPSNVMLIWDPVLKRRRAVITDFGLSLKISDPLGRLTAIAGTPAYMAPEQLTGGSVSYAADQYALGLVLGEMLTGVLPIRHLERGSSTESKRLLEAWFRQYPKVNGRSRAVIRRALEFAPEKRFRDIREMAVVLEGKRRRARIWAAAAALTGAAAVTVAFASSRSSAYVANPVLITPESGLSSAAAISRDGRWIAYSSDRFAPGNLDIYLQNAGGGAARRLTTDPSVDSDPSVSPDGNAVAFWSERRGGGLYIINADGTGERLLYPGGRSPAFSPDGRWIAFWLGERDDAAPSGQLYLISPKGGQPRRLAADFADARFPTWNSTGDRVLFDGCRAAIASIATCADWWVTRVDGTGTTNTGAVALLKSLKIELPTPPQKVWRGDRLIFSGSAGDAVPLLSLSLARDKLRATGAPQKLTSGEFPDREPAVAQNGAIVFGRATSAMHIWRIPLDGAGPERFTDDPSLDGCPSVARDGSALYFVRKVNNIRQVMVRDLASSGESLVFRSQVNSFWPVASPDGSRAVFELRDENNSSIWVVNRDGHGARRLCVGCSHPTSWFDDRSAFYTTAAGQIALLDTATNSSRIVLSPEPGAVLGGADWNPVNHRLLYTSGQRGGGKQVFAVRFDPSTHMPAGPRAELSRDIEEIDQPHWSANGESFYFLSKRDNSNCLWGRSFNPQNQSSGPPFPVAHYHDMRFSPDRASPVTRALTASSSSIFIAVGEVTDTLWLGKLTDPPLQGLFRSFPF